MWIKLRSEGTKREDEELFFIFTKKFFFPLLIKLFNRATTVPGTRDWDEIYNI